MKDEFIKAIIEVIQSTNGLNCVIVTDENTGTKYDFVKESTTEVSVRIRNY